MKFLIVDDSITVRSMVRQMLKNEFSESVVVEASDGKLAFKELTKESFDFIITDFEMEGVDGASFISKVKSNKLLAKKTIIFFTSRPEAVKTIFNTTVHVVDKLLGKEGLKNKLLELIKK